MIGLGAALLVIVSTFLPMLSIGGIGAGLFDAGDERGKEIAYMIIVLALLMAGFSFLANKKHLASIGTFIFASLLTLISFKWFSDATEFNADYGSGLILYLLGSISGVISSILGFMKK